jgi:hypothetical protein
MIFETDNLDDTFAVVKRIELSAEATPFSKTNFRWPAADGGSLLLLYGE